MKSYTLKTFDTSDRRDRMRSAVALRWTAGPIRGRGLFRSGAIADRRGMAAATVLVNGGDIRAGTGDWPGDTRWAGVADMGVSGEDGYSIGDSANSVLRKLKEEAILFRSARGFMTPVQPEFLSRRGR